MNGRRSRMVRRSMALALTAKPAAVGVVALAPHAASAVTPIMVPCDVTALRNDLITAQGVPATSLSLTSGCTYNLTVPEPTSTSDGLPVITKAVTIAGNGDTITRGSARLFRILHVSSTGSLTVDHLTISNGHVNNASGGGIYNQGGQLSLTSSTVKDSRSSATGTSISAKGGGIFMDGNGTTTINASTITNNFASMNSAATSTGTLTINATGGGIAAKGGKLVVRDSSITANQAIATATGAAIGNNPAPAASASGGGISLQTGFFSSNSLTASITGTTLSGNSAHASALGTATSRGGGLDQDTSQSESTTPPVITTKITNTTITGNAVTATTATAFAATVTAPPPNTGGGVEASAASLTATDSLTLVNDTIAANTAAAGAGVDRPATDGGTLKATNTILASNTGGNCAGTIVDGTHNISYPPADASCTGGTYATGNPALGALNPASGGDPAKGVPSATMALGTGSAAIDAASAAACQASLPPGPSPSPSPAPAPVIGAGGIDQRGLPRAEVAADASCDIGAYEVQPVVVAVSSPSPSPTAAVVAATPALPKAGTGQPGAGGDVPWQAVVPPLALAGGAVLSLRRSRRGGSGS